MNIEAQALADEIKRDLDHSFIDTNDIGKKLDRLAAMTQPPAGWVMVPVEPTEAMLRTDIERADWNGCDGTHRARAVYRAMLSAAPKPEDTK